MTFLLRRAAACLVLVPCFAGAATLSPEWAAECEARLPATQVDVKVVSAPVTYSTSLGVSDLTRRQNPPPAKGSRTLGLTERRARTQIDGQHSLLTRPSEPLACLRPKVTVTLSLEPHTVFVAREFAAGSCAYHHIADHEMKHVQVNHLALTRTAAALRNELKSSFGNRVFYGTPDELETNLDQHLKDWMDWVTAEMDKTLRLHQDIDSPQEYARNNTACGGEISRILTQHRAH